MSIHQRCLIYIWLIVIKGQGDGHTSENRQSFIDMFDSPVESNLIFTTINKCYYKDYEFGDTTSSICYYKIVDSY